MYAHLLNYFIKKNSTLQVLFIYLYEVYCSEKIMFHDLVRCKFLTEQNKEHSLQPITRKVHMVVFCISSGRFVFSISKGARDASALSYLYFIQWNKILSFNNISLSFNSSSFVYVIYCR